MKQYYITSLYTEGNQMAIQQKHAGDEIFRKHILNPTGIEADILTEYLFEHKTMVSLGVGQVTEILKLYSYIKTHEDKLRIPFGLFLEPSINYTATCLSFVATEKLCANIHHSMNNLLKEFSCYSLYDLKKLEDDKFPLTYQCPYSKVNFIVNKNQKGEFYFDVSYLTSDLPVMQNEELMPTDLDNPEVIEKLYQELNTKDFYFYQDSEEIVDIKEPVLKEFYYNFEEMNLLMMTKTLRLK